LQRTLQVGNRKWQFIATAPANYGTAQSDDTLSGFITIFGAGLTGLLVVCFWLDTQNRRRNALLTSKMSTDLSDERSSALAQQGKEAAILSSIADAVFALDKNGKIMLFNKAATNITGYKSADVIGRHFGEVLQFVREDKLPGNRFIERALRGKVTSSPAKTMLVLPDGRHVPIANTAAPIIDANGRQLGVIVIFRDTSHEHQLEQAKTEFVSLVSHQLRAPLTAMRLFVEMLLDDQVGKLNKQQRDYLVKVELSTARMIDLVSDFLNTSRIELERLKVEPTMLHLEDIVADCIDALRPLATQKQLALSFEKPSLPAVAVEANLYNQIVNNLLNNAIRYTPTGGSIIVTLKRTHNGYQLDVADTGIGIPKSAQGKLFERFYRADNAKRVESEGSGLGLYLIRHILELSHGKVWFDSKEGKGTTFHVIIPLSGMTPKHGVVSLT
jgi:two-component system phosphate regulon sensor histidine kinase PhoR